MSPPPLTALRITGATMLSSSPGSNSVVGRNIWSPWSFTGSATLPEATRHPDVGLAEINKRKPIRTRDYAPLLHGRREHDAAVCDAAFFATLQINGAGQLFVAVERAPGDPRNFLVVDDGLAVLHQCDPTATQRDVVGLPCSGLAWQFRRRCQEPVHPAHVMARRLFD